MMNRKEQTKKNIIVQCCAGKITAKDAAQRLKISVRQVENLKKKTREGVSLLHGNCGRTSAKALAPELAQRVIEEYRALEEMRINFTHFHEILEAKGVQISYTAMRGVLVKAGFQSPKTRRSKKAAHKTRERRARFGELLQADASPHDWFGTGKKQALHGFVDDATGRITGLHISENECMNGYPEVMRQTLLRYGTPEALYADGLSIFFAKSKAEDLSIEEELSGIRERKTQFGQIADSLGIQLIHAHSCQAKGRVERLWGTLQSRLPVEFALRGIKTAEEANRFLKEEYVEIFNARFAVNPKAKSAFVPLPQRFDLDRLLAYRITRTLDSGGCFGWNNVRLQVLDGPVSCKAEILASERSGIRACIGDKLYPVRPLSKGKESITSTESVDAILSRFVFLSCLKNEHAA